MSVPLLEDNQWVGEIIARREVYHLTLSTSIIVVNLKWEATTSAKLVQNINSFETEEEMQRIKHIRSE